jgi:hypothetical protein
MAEIVYELYPFIVALYLVDALAWVSTREVVFASLTGESFRTRRPGLNLIGLLPFAMDLRVAANRPIATRSGVLVPPEGPVTAGALSNPSNYQTVPYTEARQAKVEHTTVKFNDFTRWKAPTPGAALHVQALVLELSGLPEAQRDDRIRKQLRAAFDPDEARRRLDEFSAATEPLVALDDALFFTIFIVLPGCAILAPAIPALMAIVAALSACLWAVTAAATVRLARRLATLGILRPDAVRLATALLLPPTAFRGRHALVAELVHDLEPLAIAAALAPGECHGQLVRAERAAVERALAAESPDHWKHAWKLRSELLTDLLERTGLPETEPVAPRGSEVGLICPACTAAYRPGFERCSDCNVTLVPAIPNS